MLRPTSEEFSDYDSNFPNPNSSQHVYSETPSDVDRRCQGIGSSIRYHACEISTTTPISQENIILPYLAQIANSISENENTESCHSFWKQRYPKLTSFDLIDMIHDNQPNISASADNCVNECLEVPN